MSNIPFNTVASILGTSQMQHQVSAAKDRKLHESVRSQQQQTQRVREHNESVEDPGDYGVLNIGEEARQRGHQQDQQPKPSKQDGEQVEIQGLSAAPPAGDDAGPVGPPRLDISA